MFRFLVSISFRDVVYAANLQAVLKRCHVRISGDNLFNGYDNTSAVRQIEIVIRKHNVRIAKGQADALCKRIGGKRNRCFSVFFRKDSRNFWLFPCEMLRLFKQYRLFRCV